MPLNRENIGSFVDILLLLVRQGEAVSHIGVSPKGARLPPGGIG